MKFPVPATLVWTLAAPAVLAAPPAPVRVQNLTCEYLVNPLGVGAARPRLRWNLASDGRGVRQTAYQILVARDAKALAANRGDLWNSGKVAANDSPHIPYAGTPLVSGVRCVWKARIWDGAGRPSAWSAPAAWEMGLLRREEWRGRWIGRTSATEYQPAPLLRREFTLRGKVRRARIYVCGLGYHELHVNGAKVGDPVLDPGYTRYDKRALVVTHDVTRLLRAGGNALGVILGTGWYNVHTRAVWDFHKAPWRAAPEMLLDLRVEYADGRTETIASDARWKTATGPILFDSIYGGETYDARRERPGWDRPGYDDSGWDAAQIVAPPKGRLVAQQHPPIKIHQTIAPVKITEPKPGVFLFDMGQNFAGWARLRVRGPAGTRIGMRFGERRNADGTLNTGIIEQHIKRVDASQPFQTDTYVLKGRGIEAWEPRFTYHGFQYVEMTGFPAGGKPTLDTLRGRFVHSAVPSVGEFVCSNDLINRIWRAGRASYLSNLQGIPTDCPHREKNGWTGDAHLAAEQGLLNFDGIAVYEKWLNDLDDEQRENGALPGIVPTSGWGYAWGNGPAWDSAFVLIPWYLYRYTGDTRALREHYAGMKRYVDYLGTRSQNHIVAIGLGDWVPYQTQTPVAVTDTGYYYRDARIVSEAAALLGNRADSQKYAALAETIKNAFNERFFDPKTGLYANGGQTALGCALYQGLVPTERRGDVVANLVAAVEKRNNHIDTGILGAKYVPNALLAAGRADVAYALAAQRDLPSWGHWIDQGATTLWENWNGAESLNHIMFGDILAWFVKALAGLDVDHSSPGFRHIVLKPHVVGDLRFARAAYDSVRGRIESGWKIENNGTLTLAVAIPANATATVYVPTSSPPSNAATGGAITEGGKPANRAEGVAFVRSEDGYAVFNVVSGRYIFAAKGFHGTAAHE